MFKRPGRPEHKAVQAAFTKSDDEPCCLAALAFRFDDARVCIDQQVWNAARLLKVYGTMARKGDDTLDRPHRLSRLLEVDRA